MENPVDAKRRKQSARLLQTYHLPASERVTYEQTII